jgi:hypothetical protein
MCVLEMLDKRVVVMNLKELSGHFPTETRFIFEYPVIIHKLMHGNCCIKS